MKICKIGIPNWLLIPVNSFLPLESKKNIFGDTGGWGGGGCSQIPTTLPPASLIIQRGLNRWSNNSEQNLGFLSKVKI